MSGYPPVNIEVDTSDLGTFEDGDEVWKVASLLYHVKEQGLEVFDLPLCGINLATTVWDRWDREIKSFVRQWKRADAVNLDYPVILDDDGFIMDGWHRIAKALFLGLPTVKAVRFNETPKCDYLKE